MKKIRIDYYNYRLKKGRAQLLLQKVEGTQNYRIPCHYVWSGEHLDQRVSGHRMEDDGDLNAFMKAYLMGTGTAVTDPDDLD